MVSGYSCVGNENAMRMAWMQSVYINYGDYGVNFSMYS